jgi:putative proteasome-type protease
MTYCLAIKVNEGLVCLADGRVTSGTQVSNARKVSLVGSGPDSFCIMTSGLRSVRDKTLAYLERAMRGKVQGFNSLLDAATAYARCLRQVAEEDRTALAGSGLEFNLHSLMAGQLKDDPEPNIYLVYPEGNWIAVDTRTPYLSIGATTYGKPILDRTLRPETALTRALKVAYLSFDSTRVSSADVGFPIDMLTYGSEERRWREIHYDYDQLLRERQWWNEHLVELVDTMPDGPWVDQLLPQGAPRLSLVSDD